MMTKEEFQKTLYNCSYGEYVASYCPNCTAENCPHRDAFRRFPISTGGLGLCPKLKEVKEDE